MRSLLEVRGGRKENHRNIGEGFTVKNGEKLVDPQDYELVADLDDLLRSDDSNSLDDSVLL